MALQLVVDSLDGIPDALKGEYAEKDGKFHLNVDGIEDTSGLKSALDKERTKARDFEKKVKRWEALGKTDEEISKLLADHEEAARKKAESEGDFDKVLKQHQDKWAKEKGDLERELTAARTSERGAIIGTGVLAALTKAGATEEGLDLLPDRLSARVNPETVDGKRVLKIMQADGETPMAGSGKDGLATLDDLVKEAASKWPSLFKGTGNSGSGKEPGKGGFGNSGKTITRADWEKMSPAEKQSKHRDGFKVVD
jgi:hypothetical protein